MKRTPTLAALLLLILLALFGGQQWLAGDSGPPPEAAPASTGPADGALQDFAAEERGAILATLGLIDSGGPFPHAKDGSVFQNREGRLPPRAAGYYHEYTVETPNSPDRGARRIVTGAGGEAYYTRDHYDSFLQLR